MEAHESLHADPLEIEVNPQNADILNNPDYIARFECELARRTLDHMDELPETIPFADRWDKAHREAQREQSILNTIRGISAAKLEEGATGEYYDQTIVFHMNPRLPLGECAVRGAETEETVRELSLL